MHMASSDSPDISLSNLSCRILTVSSSLEQAISLVQRIRGHDRSSQAAGKRPDDATSETSVPVDGVVEPTVLGQLVKIPWTITNKYYSANVHLAAHTIHGLSPNQVRNIPAIIFVWCKGEPYQSQVERLAQDLDGYEPEVSLAVRIRAADSQAVAKSTAGEVEAEEDGEVDEFLSSHGFEYIDVREESGLTRDVENGPQFSDGVPNFPRVIDALSTIMWSSMQSKTVKAGKFGKPTNERREWAYLNWVQGSTDEILLTVEGRVEKSSSDVAAMKRLEAEFSEMTRWLEEDGEGKDVREDPWKSAASSGGVCASPTVMEETGSVTEAKFGFDDDFTVFVSAPVGVPDGGAGAKESGRTTPENFSDDVNKLGAANVGQRLYKSLGSVSDFGSDDGKEARDETAGDEGDEEELLPSKEEVEATRWRIFGDGSVGDVERALPDSFTFETFPGEDKDGDGDYEMAPFDLRRVLGRLQAMKEEISCMESEEERRKAAAKVALGLVYGLEGRDD
ncbi:hypothetical protein AX17_006264 [Amanita inopinata Kibby_2008]|nr:hypothetical protein AX17_006264 [Amanita inopinata Kibby_2008]